MAALRIFSRALRSCAKAPPRAKAPRRPPGQKRAGSAVEERGRSVDTNRFAHGSEWTVEGWAEGSGSVGTNRFAHGSEWAMRWIEDGSVAAGLTR